MLNSNRHWILKPPYSGNKQHFTFHVQNSYSKAVSYINKKVRKDIYASLPPACYEIPYLMIQEVVTKNNEAKLLFLNKV